MVYERGIGSLRVLLKVRRWQHIGQYLSHFHDGAFWTERTHCLSIMCLCLYSNSLADYLRKVGLPSKKPPAPITSNLELMTRLTSAERLRIINEVLVQPDYEEGLGLVEGSGVIESIFALHDHETTKKWIHSWSQKWILDYSDLDLIRDYAGTEVTLLSYFIPAGHEAWTDTSAAGRFVFLLSTTLLLFSNSIEHHFNRFLVLWQAI